MFGLMRNAHPSRLQEDIHQYRLSYCGTCKSMGAMYGQGTRFLLNFDAVFLSEMLSALSDVPMQEWNSAFFSHNCFDLPKNQGEIPLSLQYVATVNVILAELKTDDNLKDQSFVFWGMVKKAFSTSFRKANQQMADFGLDTADLWKEIAAQQALEKGNPQVNFWDYAQPTANMTAMIFAKGAALMGKTAEIEKMYALGENFGKLIYLLDAYKDYEQDKKAQQFNALRATIAPHFLLEEQKDEVILYLKKLETDLLSSLKEFAFPPALIQHFAQRLSSNLAYQLSPNAPKSQWQPQQSLASAKVLLKERWQKAKEFAQAGTSEWGKLQGTLQYNFLLGAAFIAPKLPQHAPPFSSPKSQWTVWAMLVALLAALGFGKKAAKSCNSKRKIYRTLNFSTMSKDCWSDCLSECCSSCCESCCQSCCQSCCDSCCNSMCEGETGKILGFVGLGILVIIIIVMLIVLL